MLKRVIETLAEQGFDEVTINVHHFADQIVDFINQESLPISDINVSDETEHLLETGGGILHAEPFLSKDMRPFLVHNVDILSNADLKYLYKEHETSGDHITLLVSGRQSDRKLVFDRDFNLKGWINLKTGQRLPTTLDITQEDRILAFSGIYIMSPDVFAIMKNHGFSGAFPIMSFFLSGIHGLRIRGICQDNLEIIDIGKPDTLHRANLKIQ